MIKKLEVQNQGRKTKRLISVHIIVRVIGNKAISNVSILMHAAKVENTI
jgi:hypothetical protein